MPRITKAQRATDHFRSRIEETLAQTHGWRGYEDIRHWLQKLLELNRSYTQLEKDAFARVVAARTPFYEWDGYSVPDLVTEALKYVADMSFEDEEFLTGLKADGATRITLREMGQLVALARFAGVDIVKFKPIVDTYDAAA